MGPIICRLTRGNPTWPLPEHFVDFDLHTCTHSLVNLVVQCLCVVWTGQQGNHHHCHCHRRRCRDSGQMNYCHETERIYCYTPMVRVLLLPNHIGSHLTVHAVLCTKHKQANHPRSISGSLTLKHLSQQLCTSQVCSPPVV